LGLDASPPECRDVAAVPVATSLPSNAPTGFFSDLDTALTDARPQWQAAAIGTYYLRYEITDVERFGDVIVDGWSQIVDGAVVDARHFIDGEPVPDDRPVEAIGYSIDSLFDRIEAARLAGDTGGGLYDPNGQLVAFTFGEPVNDDGNGAAHTIRFNIHILELVEGLGEPPTLIEASPRLKNSGPDAFVPNEPLPIPTLTPSPQPIAPLVPVAVGDGMPSPPLPAPQDIALGTFLLRVNGAESVGSGIAFVDESQIDVQLLVGPTNEYLQFYLTGSATEYPAGVWDAPSIIYGHDASGTVFEERAIEGPAANVYTVEPVGEDGFAGVFDMNLCDYNGMGYRMTGAYHVAGSTGSNWSCDWTADLVTDCGFSEE